MKAKKKEADQAGRFIAAAKAVGVDESGRGLDKVFRKIVKAMPRKTGAG